MTESHLRIGAGGALPGLWPAAPEAPILVPIPAKWEPKDYQSDIKDLPLSPTFVLEYDTCYFGATLDGMLVTSRQSRYEPWLRIPLRSVLLVQPGMMGGLRDNAVYYFKSDRSDEFVHFVRLKDGPAVWLQTEHAGYLIPTPDPIPLAAEIERRRQRAWQLGSAATTQALRVDPALADVELQKSGSISPGGIPSVPALLRKRRQSWVPLSFDHPGHFAPQARQPAEPLADVPYPETFPDVALNLRESYPPLYVNVSNHRIRLSQQPLPSATTPFHDPENEGPPQNNGSGSSIFDWSPGVRINKPYLTAPIVQFPVIRSGTLSRVPAEWSVRVFASDARTEIRSDIVDGPAVWLWGMSHEFVLCTPDAQKLAADLRWRRRIASLFPLSGGFPVEFVTWWVFPDTALVRTEEGWCLPPSPAYAPSEPTIVPPGTWQSTPD